MLNQSKGSPPPWRDRQTGRLVHVLLVEDDDVAAAHMERSFKKSGIQNPLLRASDGVDALEILRGENGKEKLPSPFMIFLDLRMPRMDGLEFLAEIRSDPKLESSVVFVLTTSPHEEDRTAAYKQHIAGYIQKTRVGRDCDALVDMLHNYWATVDLPGEAGVVG